MKQDNPFCALIVDDEKATRRFLQVTLASHGYSVVEAASGAEALKKAVVCDPAFILLELSLPDKDGVEVIREIRNRGIAVPIVILSVRDQEVDKIEALDAGADDYMTKPFNAGELLARLRAVVRRHRPQLAVLEAGKFRMDIDRHTLELAGQPLSLTPIEYEILRLLIANAGKVVTRHKILKEVWRAELTGRSSHLLHVTVSKLRDKIETDSDRPLYLLTEMGIGYRLCAV